MLRGNSLLVRFARLLLPLPLLVLTLSGCDNVRRFVTGTESDFSEYGVYRIFAITMVPNTEDLPTKTKSRRKANKYRAGRPQPKITMGTGFLINNKNLVVTNRHVVEYNGRRAHSVKIILTKKGEGGKEGKLEFVDAEVLKTTVGDPSAAFQEDLALLRPARAMPGKPLRIADYEPVVGNDVQALGYPGAADADLQNRLEADAKTKRDFSPEEKALAERVKTSEDYAQLYFKILEGLFDKQYKKNEGQFSLTFTQGVVSRTFKAGEIPIVQHQAPLSQGNSGGPLLDACRSVIGINTYGGGLGSQGVFMALSGGWLANQIKAQGEEVMFEKPCVATSRSRQMIYIIGVAAALLSMVTLVVAFRRTPVVQRGLTIMRRPVAAPPSFESAPTVGAATVLDPKVTRGRGTLQLIRIGAGRSLMLPMDRIAAPGGFVVGRESGNEGVIDEPTASKLHARLSLNAEGQLLIEDLQSANGTFKNGQRITRDTFASGDTVKFGAAEFRIELPGGATVMAQSASLHQPLVLSGIDADGRTVRYVLETAGGERTWTVGRKSESANFVINNPRVSAPHARIRYQPSRGFEVMDLESSNGTRIDGRKVGADYVSLDGVRVLSLADLDLNINKA